ncbi:MAG TPA: sigma factor-like helix-turn-helix DNA-binding protein [Ktedonobacterales bacterium]|nr:sigma factor-like helix-turn-helix DNA-binding protein [Ktedonobacterales bacterium]
MDESNDSARRGRRPKRSVDPVETDAMPEVTRRAAVAPARPDAVDAAVGDTTEMSRSMRIQSRPELDPRDARTQARLRLRTPSGGYEVSEAELVQAIRAWDAHNDMQAVRGLCEVLVDRCMPEFQRRSWGLRHRPELMEDAIAGMIEQLLREAREAQETFMTLNFVHYLRCLCADNFNRVLRQEGLSYRRDEQGRPAGRPQHVPQVLVDRIDVAAEDREDASVQPGVVADPRDTLEERMAAVEAERILGYLPDPMDRQILVLRALEHMRWDDIAKLCGKTERTMRLRYEKALVLLRQCIEAETAAVAR